MVVLYTTHCSKCKVLATKLQAKGIEYTEFTDVKEMLKKGIASVPWLEVEGELMNFTQANDWVNIQ